MGRTYNCWMLNCWCITWPVGFKRLKKLLTLLSMFVFLCRYAFTSKTLLKNQKDVLFILGDRKFHIIFAANTASYVFYQALNRRHNVYTYVKEELKPWRWRKHSPLKHLFQRLKSRYETYSELGVSLFHEVFIATVTYSNWSMVHYINMTNFLFSEWGEEGWL